MNDKLPNPNVYIETHHPRHAEYAYLYNTTARTIKSGEDFPFDYNGIISDGIIHNYGSPVIIIKRTGTYKITFNVVADSSANQLNIVVNNRNMTYSLYGNTNNDSNFGQTLIQLREGDVLALRNVDDDMSVSALTYDMFNVVNAYLLLELIN